jgi:asparagine N-glycosylation enzyme membrane subunit Stt3
MIFKVSDTAKGTIIGTLFTIFLGGGTVIDLAIIDLYEFVEVPYYLYAFYLGLPTLAVIGVAVLHGVAIFRRSIKLKKITIPAIITLTVLIVAVFVFLLIYRIDHCPFCL